MSERLKGIWFHWHKWTKWGDRQPLVYQGSDSVTGYIQFRQCTICNKEKSNRIWLV